MKKYIYLIIFFLFLNFNYGCGKKAIEYTKETLAQGIIDLCMEEYKMNGVSVSIKGTTVYIYLKVENILLDINNQLTESTRSKLENLFLVASRACISTCSDANINFYKIIAYDDKMPGIRIILSRYILDIKRFALGDISRGENFKRMAMNIEFNPIIFGAFIIKGFFQDMENKDKNYIIKNYFPEEINLLNISPSIYSQITELNLKDNKKYEIIEIKSKQLAEKKALLYCKIKETYVPKKDIPQAIYSTPNNFINEYLFLIDIKKFPKVIEKILSFYALDKNNKFEYIGFPSEYSKYKNLKNWSTDQGKEIDIKLSDFLAEQIQERINGDFKSEKKLNNLYSINYIQIKFEHKTKTFNIDIDIEKNSTPEALELYDNYYINLLKEVVEIVTTTLRQYDFTDFKKIKINYITKNKILILNKDTIQKYRKNKISIKDIIKTNTNNSITAITKNISHTL